MAATTPPPTLTDIIALTRQLLPSPSPTTRPNDQPNSIHDARQFGSPSKSEQEEDDDGLLTCGIPALHLLHHHPDAALKFGHEKLHMVPYREVKTCWRRYYADAAVRKVLGILERVVEQEVTRDREGKSRVWKEGEGEGEGRDAEEEDDWITQVVKTLDMALILTAAPGREELIELIFSALEAVIAESGKRELDHEAYNDKLLQKGQQESGLGHRPCKRRKLSPTPHQPRKKPNIPQPFPTEIPAHHLPHLKYPLPRLPCSSLSLSSFQSRITDPVTSFPFIMTGAIDFWPAMSERPWNSPAYLLERTLGGRRLVPVEVGRSYTDEGWGQSVMGFGEFLGEFMLEDVEEAEAQSTRKRERKKEGDRPTGYLAQHDLFAQIPSLRADISIPDYCYVDLPPPPPSGKPAVEKLATPLLNAWFGPAGTISPLHTDPYHNILAQVVGSKYIRLYGSSENDKMYPRGKDERGVDMGNTSQVDLDVAMGVWEGISCWSGAAVGEEKGRGEEEEDEEEEDEAGMSRDDMDAEYERNFTLFKSAAYVECVLGPGECLYIPPGWWHYVQSLTPSFSVSFWFN